LVFHNWNSAYGQHIFEHDCVSAAGYPSALEIFIEEKAVRKESVAKRSARRSKCVIN